MGIPLHDYVAMAARMARQRQEDDEKRNPPDSLPSSAEPKPTVCNEPLGQEQGEGQDTSRIVVRYTCFRKRLLDPDNATTKYFTDGLRYAGLLPGDTEQDITLAVTQRKCAKGERERTEITLEYPETTTKKET